MDLAEFPALDFRNKALGKSIFEEKDMTPKRKMRAYVSEDSAVSLDDSDNERGRHVHARTRKARRRRDSSDESASSNDHSRTGINKHQSKHQSRHEEFVANHKKRFEEFKNKN